MPTPGEQPKTWMSPAQVRATHPEHRLVDVKWIGTETTKHNVIVVNDYGSYSFPKVGDTGLVIGNGFQYYFLGKIEYGYDVKVNGRTDSGTGENTRIKDQQTGIDIYAKLVKDGEIFISNIAKKVWLSIANSGDFSIMNGFNEGLKYFSKDRFLRLAGMCVQVLGNGLEAAFGTRIRDIPGLGKKVVPDESGVAPATEFYVLLKKLGLKTNRLHLGYVSDSTLGIDEFGTWGARLKAILEVCQGGVPLAVLKMDEIGNIELSTIGPAASTMLDSGPGGYVLLGGLAAMAFSAVLGEQLLVWLNTHVHSSSVGPTGTPTIPATNAILSSKVKVSP